MSPWLLLELLGYLAQPSILRDTGIGEDDIEPALLPLDLCEEAVEIAKVRHVAVYAGHVASDLLYCRLQLRITASRYEDGGALRDERLRGGQANAARATRDECGLSFQLAHIFVEVLPSHGNRHLTCRPEPNGGGLR